MRSLLAAIFLVGCAHPAGLKSQSDDLQYKMIRAAELNAVQCAPQQMAMAEANAEFLALESEQGDPRRARHHLAIAVANVDAALAVAGTCGPKDSDGDGFMDEDDACPDQPEDFDDWQDEDGCPDGDPPPPPVEDADGDGLLDDVDGCPDEAEDMDGFEDADGCPDLDNDNDAVTDSNDDCPLTPEDPDNWQDEDGCPDPDNDGDNIADEVDKCPLQAENVNQYFDEDGCPDEKPELVRVVRQQIVIEEKIQFTSGRATILSASHSVLDAVVQVLTDFDQLRVRIEGHTDSQGGDSANQRLSERRAEAVRAYLIENGVASDRLEAVGFGEMRPIASNRNADGRAENRRVEFHIIGNDEVEIEVDVEQ